LNLESSFGPHFGYSGFFTWNNDPQRIFLEELTTKHTKNAKKFRALLVLIWN